MLAGFAEDVFSEKQETILREVGARIAAGQTAQKVAWVSGVAKDVVDRLLRGLPAEHLGRRDNQDSQDAIEALGKYLEGEQQGASDDACYALTPTFNHLQTLYAQAHQWGTLFAITGAWGIGKSEAARFYAANRPRTHDQPGAVRIQFASTDRTTSAALAKIAEHLATVSHAYRNGSHMGAIEAALRPGDMLILEECQELRDAAGLVADLYDATGIAIVIQGNPDMSGMIWGKGAKFARLASRANRFDFLQTTPEDVDAWLAWKGAGEGLTIAERKALTAAACTVACRATQNGGLRALSDVFRIADKLYDQKVDAGILQSIAARIKPDAPGAKRGKP